jgi:hypothetical protein
MWLPALGAALFLIAAVAWTMSPSNASSASSAAGAGTTTVTTAIASAAAPAGTPPPAQSGTRQVKIPPFRAH